MDSLLPEVQEIFRDVFDQPSLVITRQSNAANLEGWDSLAHIQLIAAISRQYRVRFALGELEGLQDAGELLDLLREKLSGK